MATQTDRASGVAFSTAIKVPCRVASTANLTLSGEQTIDGVDVVAGDRVLVKDQTATTDNGIWIAAAGAWTRAADFDGTNDVVTGTRIAVAAGTTHAGTFWYVSTSGDPVPGDAIAFSQSPSDAAAAASATAAASSATAAAASAASISTPIPVASGGTAATTASGARTNLGFSGSGGTVASANIEASAVTAAKLDKDTALGFHMVNGKLTTSVASGALTIALKTQAGNDPSTADPVLVLFPSAAGYTAQTFTSATSLVISSGSTLSTTSGTAFRLWVVVFNDNGAAKLGIINCLNGTNVYPLDATDTAAATAEGGAGGADSAHTFYATAAISATNFTVIAYLTWNSGLTTAGTWDAAPSPARLVMNRTPLPGQIVQRVGNTDGAVATGTTTIPEDDTIPQSTEGNEFMTQAVTPTSAANLLEIEAALQLGTGAGDVVTAALFQDSGADALAAAYTFIATTNPTGRLSIEHRQLAGTTSATTFKVRAGQASAATITFNGVGGSRYYGGVANSYLRIREVMA